MFCIDFPISRYHFSRYAYSEITREIVTVDMIICIYSLSQLGDLEEGKDLERTGKMNLQVTADPHFFISVNCPPYIPLFRAN